MHRHCCWWLLLLPGADCICVGTPPSPRPLPFCVNPDVLEAAFLVLDTLALANRDVGAVVAQQRLEALSHIGWQLPVELLLQQQTLCLSYINSMAAAVTPNKQLLESMGAAGSDAALSAQPGVQVSSASGVMMQAAAHR